MPHTPQVSVIIPCHDAADTLMLQLGALSRQVQAPPFEVIVVDNGSRDQLDRTIAQWRPHFPQLRLIDAADRAGAGHARNVGVLHASAQKLLFCDADDLVSAEWVAAGAAALDEVHLACGVDVTLPDTDFGSVDVVWRAHFAGSVTAGVERRETPADYPILLGGNLAILRETYLLLGGYDPSMTLGNEDNDLAVRAERAGHLVHRVPAMRIAIRERGDLRGFFRRARVAGRGHMQLCERHDLRQVSPHLRDGAWRLDLPRSLIAAGRMATRPRAQQDWTAVATRLGAAVGLWEGELLARTGKFPPAQTGITDGTLKGSQWPTQD